MKFLLIDANNLAVRNSFANAELKNSNGIPSGVHFGTFQSLINLKQSYPDYQFLCVWDGRSLRRKIESEDGVKRGIILLAYKENRKKESLPQPLLDFHSQSIFLKRGIAQTGIPQIRLENFEADDVISSYVRKLKSDNEIICVTSDQDYYQLLDDKVSIYDGMKQKLITKGDWINDNKIHPKLHIDVGALCGDAGDNIEGVPSIGEKTAIKIVKEFGSWEKALDAYKKQLTPYREQYPDLSTRGLELEFTKLKSIVTETKKPKYPEITIGMPFTGVALAIEEKKIKEKIPKSTIMSVMFEQRVKLAYSLKKMDDNIENLPDIHQGTFNAKRILEYFEYYGIYSLVDSISVFQ